jgi:hypothetical protein
VNLDVFARTTGYIGRCLAFVRACLGVGAGAATAFKAYKAAEHQHPDDTDPPAGVPVFWSPAKIGPFAGAGHVALSLGDGLVRSTAWPRTGRIGDVAIDELTRAWRRTYLGWTEDLNGVRVWFPPTTPEPTPAPTVSLEVIDMRQAITDVFVLYTGFPPSEAQVREYTAFWMLNGPDATAAAIRDSAAAQVAQAFRDELGREPESPAVVGAHLAQFGGDIAAIRAALAASPEGQAHR